MVIITEANKKSNWLDWFYNKSTLNPSSVSRANITRNDRGSVSIDIVVSKDTNLNGVDLRKPQKYNKQIGFAIESAIVSKLDFSLPVS